MFGVRGKTGLEFNYKIGEKIKVSPIGDIIGVDGRTFTIDGSAIIEDIVKNGVHIPLDENHWDGRAMGWFDKNSFEVRDDGIYAALELTTDGENLVTAKAYRYLSPTYVMADNRVVVGLDSVGLVNRPNLLNYELNKKGENLEEIAELKAKNEALEKEVAELKAVKENNKSEEPNEEAELLKLKAEIESLKQAQQAQAEQNSKLATMFGKMDLEKNNNNSKSLTDGEKVVAKMLGISEEEYSKNKQGGN